MSAFLVPVGLMLIVVMASLASTGWDLFEMRNRENWWWAGILLLEMALMRNGYMAAVLFMIILGLFQIGRSWFVLRTFVIPVAGVTGAYVILSPLVQPWMIAPVLWAGVAVGCGLGAWALLGLLVQTRPFEYGLKPGWCGAWWVYEQGTGTDHVLCGQGNTMHLMGTVTLAATCCVGLAVIGAWWALVCLPLCLLPMLASMKAYHAYEHSRATFHFNGGVLSLGALGLGLVLLAWPWLGASLGGLGGLVLVGLVWRAKPWTCETWYDSGRLSYWKDALWLCWWPAGWQKRLFGFGSQSWFPATIRVGEHRHGSVFTMAHNEFVQQLVEHGLVGLCVLCAYLGDALWRTAHGGPEGQAVFLLGVVWCSIACVNFPASWYHEYHAQQQKDPQWFGSPTLNAWTFVIAILAEAF